MGLSGFRMIYAKGLIFWGGLNFTLFSISNQVRCIYIQQTHKHSVLYKSQQQQIKQKSKKSDILLMWKKGKKKKPVNEKKTLHVFKRTTVSFTLNSATLPT